MVATKNEQPEPLGWDDIPGINVLSPQEGLAYFDRRARELVGLSGEEFLRRWDAGTYQPTIGPDGEDRKLNRLIMLMPFAGRSHS